MKFPYFWQLGILIGIPLGIIYWLIMAVQYPAAEFLWSDVFLLLFAGTFFGSAIGVYIGGIIDCINQRKYLLLVLLVVFGLLGYGFMSNTFCCAG